MEHDRDADLEELLGRFGNRLNASAALNREAIGRRFFRRLAGSRESLEREALGRSRWGRTGHAWLWLPAVAGRLLGSRNWSAGYERAAPTVTIIDQTGRTVEGSGTWRRAGAGVAAERVVAAFVLGCLCGLLLAQLLGPDLAGMLRRERGVRWGQPPATVGVPFGTPGPTGGAIFAVTETGEPPGQPGSRGKPEPTAGGVPANAGVAGPEATVTSQVPATPTSRHAPQSDAARGGAGSPAPGPTSTPEHAPALETERVVIGTPDELIGANPTNPPAQPR